MKMFFLLKITREGGWEEKECSKERGKGAEKGLQNSRILKRMAGWAEIRKF